jgi:ABC-2 type transport system permease protein
VGETAAIYLRLLGARIRGDFQYRLSFALFTAGQFVVTFVDFLVVLVIFEQVPQLDGWRVEEVAFLYATASTSFHLADVFVSQVEMLPVRIRAGTFDQLLIRPLSTLVQLCADEFALRRLGKLVQAVGVLAVVLPLVDVDWTAGRVAMVPVMVVAGFAIFGSVWVALSTICFWTTESREVVNTFTYGGNFLVQYPLTVYSAWLRRLLAIAVPLGFVNYFPALYVLGRDDLFGAPGFVRFLSPLVAVGTVAVARWAWQHGVRHYRSTGS